MKTTKILITSLLAAAALSVPAFAADVTISGTAAGTEGTVTATAGTTETNATWSATDKSYTIENSTANNKSVAVGTLSIEGDYTVGTESKGWLNFKIDSSSNLSGTGTLKIVRGILESGKIATGQDWSSTVSISADTLFAGTIEINSNSTKKITASFSASAANATLNLSTTGAGGRISANSVSLGGLVGVAGTTVISAAALSDTSDSNFNNSISTANDATVRTLTLGGSGTYDFAGTVGSATHQTSLNLTKSGTGTQTFSGTTYLGNLEVSGGNLVLSGTANIAGTTTVTGGTLDLSGGTITLANAIQNSGTVTVSSGTIFVLDGLTAGEGGVYSLVSGGTVTNTAGDASFSLGGRAINSERISASTSGGYSVTVTNYSDLVWNGGVSRTWDFTTENWTSATAGKAVSFENGDSVTFSQAETTTVTVADSGVNANTVTISAGTVSFTGGAITATGGVSVTGGTLSVLNSTTLGTNKISLSGGTLQAGAANLSLANAVDVSAASEIVNDNKLTLSGQLTGSGTLTKTGEGALAVYGTNNAFRGTLQISAGTVIIGPNGDTRGDSQLTDVEHGAKILVESGATVKVNMGSTNANAPATLNGDFYLKNGSTIGSIGGFPKIAGDIVFGATDTNGNYSEESSVSFTSHWSGKTVELAGTLSGAGAVTMSAGANESGTAIYKISGAENSFSGMYTLTGETNRPTQLQLTTQGAAKNASINLSTTNTSLALGAAAVDIAGLAGAVGSSVRLVSGTAESTLTVNQATNTTFSGTIADGIALKKAGAGTLMLSGNNTYTGGTVIEEGTVVAAHANALGTTKGVEVKTDATLNLGASAVTVAGLSGAGTVDLASGTDSATLTVNGGGVFTGRLSRVSLVKQGADSTLELSNSGNWISSATVEAGTLRIAPDTIDNYSCMSITSVSVSNGAKLEIAPNSSAAVSYGLYATSGVTFAAGSKLVVDLTGAAPDVALSIITSSAIKYNNGTEDVSLTSDNLNLFVNNFVTLKGWDGLAGWAYDSSALSLTLTIPEPSMFGLLAGLGALALAGTRRRRKKA